MQPGLPAPGKLQALLPLGYPQARQARKQARKLRRNRPVWVRKGSMSTSCPCIPCHSQLRIYPCKPGRWLSNSAQILANKVKRSVDISAWLISLSEISLRENKIQFPKDSVSFWAGGSFPRLCLNRSCQVHSLSKECGLPMRPLLWLQTQWPCSCGNRTSLRKEDPT